MAVGGSQLLVDSAMKIATCDAAWWFDSNMSLEFSFADCESLSFPFPLRYPARKLICFHVNHRKSVFLSYLFFLLFSCFASRFIDVIILQAELGKGCFGRTDPFLRGSPEFGRLSCLTTDYGRCLAWLSSSFAADSSI